MYWKTERAVYKIKESDPVWDYSVILYSALLVQFLFDLWGSLIVLYSNINSKLKN